MSMRRWLLAGVLLLAAPATPAQEARIAAASDLKFALEALRPSFEQAHPGQTLTLIFGSSGKFAQQIEHGAPFDLFMSADVSLPQQLVAKGYAVEPVEPYAYGRLVLWSARTDASQLTLADLADPRWKHIAIAAPEHAPYGQRAVEALRSAGVWAAVQPRLVFGENIAHTAQLVQSQAADIGILALSLALSPQLAGQSGYALIPAELHPPLQQAWAITRHGRDNPTARAFGAYLASEPARAMLRRYGFTLPDPG